MSSINFIVTNPTDQNWSECWVVLTNTEGTHKTLSYFHQNVLTPQASFEAEFQREKLGNFDWSIEYIGLVDGMCVFESESHKLNCLINKLNYLKVG